MLIYPERLALRNRSPCTGFRTRAVWPACQPPYTVRSIAVSYQQSAIAAIAALVLPSYPYMAIAAIFYRSNNILLLQIEQYASL
ncbi:MAG: hypothetical protein F6J93_27085 [Oscillatoria sp. SIO1A7]|nr:hypothetical protein [Oscillatoria sp. SIO1A7]